MLLPIYDVLYINTNVLNIWYIDVYSLRKIYAKRQYSCLSFNG